MNTFWPSWKEQKVLTVLVVLVLLGGAALLFADARNSYTQHRLLGHPPDARDTIVIDGTGKVTAKPDIATTSFGVLSTGKDVAAVQTDNTNKVNAMIAQLKKMGIESKDVQTEQYNISPTYDYTNGKQTLTGYSVNQTVSVKIRDLSKIGAVLSMAGEQGANQVNGVNFTIDDPATLQQEARMKAITDARKKAEELAKALGVEISRVVSFSESGQYQPPMPYMTRGSMDLKAEAVAAPAPDIQPGSMDVSSNVSVTYEIR